MRRRALVPAAVLILMGCAGAESPLEPQNDQVAAFGAPTVIESVSIWQEIVPANSCTGEEVFFDGEGRAVTKLITLKEGQVLNYRLSVIAWGRGLDSHDTYALSVKLSVVAPFPKGTGQTTTQHLTYTVTRNGVPTRMRFGTRAHLTITPQGEITVNWERSFGC